MSIVLAQPAIHARPALHARPSRLAAHGPLLLFGALVLLTCAWVASLPLVPTQDGPLHLYYVNILQQLLTHQHTAYTGTYSIRHLLPPYATYYYSLVILSRVFSLETADKLILCGSIALLAGAGYTLIRTVSPASRWAPFLLLPILLNWPSFMGFANFMLATDLACLALAAWCRSSSRTDLRYTGLFLLFILCMVFTHPVPWLFTLSFAALELCTRHLRQNRRLAELPRRPLARDLAALALSSLAYFYFRQFKSKTQLISRRILNPKLHTWVTFHPPTSWARLHSQAFSLLHTQGIVLFLGSGLPHVYRDGIGVLMYSALSAALWSAYTTRHGQGFTLANVWLLFALLLIVIIIAVPDSSAGGYYLTTRLQILLYLCCIVAASDALTQLPRLAPTLAASAIALNLLTLQLAVRYIAPAARVIASLRTLPSLPADPRPGLLMRPVGAAFPPHLNFDAYNWAPVHYFRWHGLLLYNTAWLGDTLIPIRPRPDVPNPLDPTFFNQAPEFGDDPLRDETTAHRLLTHVGFALLQRDAVRKRQNPFAEQGASDTPGEFAQGWSCQDAPSHHWTLCQPTRTPPNIPANNNW